MKKNTLYKISSKDIMRNNIKIGSAKEKYDFFNENGMYEKHHKLHSWVPQYMILEKKEDGYHEFLTDILIVSEEVNNYISENYKFIGEGIYYPMDALITPVTSDEIRENFKDFDNQKIREVSRRFFKFHDKALTAKIVKIRMDKKEAKEKEEKEIERAKMLRR